MTKNTESTDSFGYWVRRRRKALDLTQETLAQRVGCAVVSLRKIEADERRPSPQMAHRLAQCLALPEAECVAFIAAALGTQAPARLALSSTPAERQPSNLPASVTSLIGRTAELAAIIDRLGGRAARLLTLTGPVGVGKTRLAIEAGQRLLPEFRDGVYLVALATVQDPALAPAATAAVLGVRETRDRTLAQAVVDFLAPREMLLILDNFEHLLPAALFLSTLLATCPSLHVLVTSRARLHVYGEYEFTVAPLQLPERAGLAAIADAPAVRLFCDRAQAAQADFLLTPSLTPTVAEICRRLDGLPLAIELAAARLKLFSIQELQQRLEDRLPVLTQNVADLPPRMQGLENAIAWSYGLLSPAQRALLARLAVFVGGFDLCAAEAVCDVAFDEPATSPERVPSRPPSRLAGSVDALLDQSLLQRGTLLSTRRVDASNGCLSCPRRLLCTAAQCETRFSMLETIRDFALEQLRTNGELAVTQRRHAVHFVAWTEQAAEHLHGPSQAIWLERLEAETSNLRAALSWLLADGQTVLAARLACALSEFWQRHGHYSEGRRWLQQTLVQMVHTSVPDNLRARTLQATATLAYRQGDWQTAQQWLVESLAVFRKTLDQRGVARTLFDLGWIALDREEWLEAVQLNEESLVMARLADDSCAVYRALTNLGWAQLRRGAAEKAAALFGEAHAVAGRIGHLKGIAVSLANLGWIALNRGDLARSKSLAQESLRLCHLLGEREALAECLEILAAAALNSGDAHRAVHLGGGAEAIWEALHVVHPPTQNLVVAEEQAIGTLYRQLAESGFETDWQHGRTMGLDAMVAFALDCRNE